MAEKYGMSSRAIIARAIERLEAPPSGWIAKLGMKMQSDQESETYKWLGSTPALREWIGGRQAKGLRANGITISNKKFESTLEVEVDDLRRAKSNQIDVRIGELVDRANAHWAALLTTLITGGTSGLCYDAHFFFDTAHQEGESSTQINDLAAGQVPSLLVADPTAPTQTEAALALFDCIAWMLTFTDDEAEFCNDAAREFLVMCPPNLWGAFQAACTSSSTIGAAGALAGNSIVSVGFKMECVMNPRLTDDDVFYIFRTDTDAKPFILQEEEGVLVQALAEGSKLEFDRDVHQYGVKALHNVGYAYWTKAVRCTLS